MGNQDGPKLQASRGVLMDSAFREQVGGLLKKSIRDRKCFLAYFDALERPAPPLLPKDDDVVEHRLRVPNTRSRSPRCCGQSRKGPCRRHSPQTRRCCSRRRNTRCWSSRTTPCSSACSCSTTFPRCSVLLCAPPPSSTASRATRPPAPVIDGTDRARRDARAPRGKIAHRRAAPFACARTTDSNRLGPCQMSVDVVCHCALRR